MGLTGDILDDRKVFRGGGTVPAERWGFGVYYGYFLCDTEEVRN